MKQNDRVKKVLNDEFEEVLRLLEFNDLSYDVFRRWYVDGRLYYHAIIDEENPDKGIIELRYIDPRKIRKVKEISLISYDGKTQSVMVEPVEMGRGAYLVEVEPAAGRARQLLSNRGAWRIGSTTGGRGLARFHRGLGVEFGVRARCSRPRNGSPNGMARESHTQSSRRKNK